MLLDRHSFYKVSKVDGNEEYDLLSGRLSKIDFDNFSYFTIVQAVEARPDLISYKVYDTVELWWLILLANDIIDPFDELKTGTVIKIPNMTEYYNFYNANAVKKGRQ